MTAYSLDPSQESRRAVASAVAPKLLKIVSTFSRTPEGLEALTTVTGVGGAARLSQLNPGNISAYLVASDESAEQIELAMADERASVVDTAGTVFKTEQDQIAADGYRKIGIILAEAEIQSNVERGFWQKLRKDVSLVTTRRSWNTTLNDLSTSTNPNVRHLAVRVHSVLNPDGRLSPEEYRSNIKLWIPTLQSNAKTSLKSAEARLAKSEPKAAALVKLSDLHSRTAALDRLLTQTQGAYRSAVSEVRRKISTTELDNAYADGAALDSFANTVSNYLSDLTLAGTSISAVSSNPRTISF